MNSRAISDRRDSSVSSENVSEIDMVDGYMRPLSREGRSEKVKRYWDKKNRRKSQKYVRYECRKNLAEKRYRY